MASYIHEIFQPVGSALEMADVLDEGKLIVPTVLCGDSKGVFEAVQSQSGKCKIDQSFAMHVKALREACAKYQIHEIVWLDNRDMIADPLTKGRTNRQELMKVMQTGIWLIEHATEKWSARRLQ